MNLSMMFSNPRRKAFSGVDVLNRLAAIVSKSGPPAWVDIHSEYTTLYTVRGTDAERWISECQDKVGELNCLVNLILWGS